MSGKEMSIYNWSSETIAYTKKLVNIRSVSPGAGEIQAAEEVLSLLHADGLTDHYTSSGFDPIENDPHHRKNAFAFLKGQSTSTLVLLGHIDTVDTLDYGPLEPLSLDPQQLTPHHAELAATELEDEEDWLFGRGVVDMKSGVAANIAIMRRLARQSREKPFPLSIVILAVADEENESAGVLQAVHFLTKLREQYGLNYLGTINTDYTTERYPGDPHRYVYTGTIGKLLPAFLCIGQESHVGSPFNGLDANLLSAELIRDLSMNDELCDNLRGQVTPPPVTLHATDLKPSYDVQLPFMSYFYLNVMTFTTNPSDLLSKLCARAAHNLDGLLARMDETEQRWRRSDGEGRQVITPRSGEVYTYAALYSQTCEQLGKNVVDQELAREWEHWPAELDKRERCLHLVRRLWKISGKQGPAVVIYYAPPYYPHVEATASLLRSAVTTVIDEHPELNLQQNEYYPYLSDLSYLHLQADQNISALQTNLPIWQDAEQPYREGAYSLPLEKMRLLTMPVVNFGPYGHGAHQRSESVLKSYTFEHLPQLLFETIEHLARLNAQQ
jgi:arginine utilization protein RocB